MASRIQNNLHQVMVGMFEGLNEIQETYNSFERQSDLLYDHNQRRKEAVKAYDNLVNWKR